MQTYAYERKEVSPSTRYKKDTKYIKDTKDRVLYSLTKFCITLQYGLKPTERQKKERRKLSPVRVH